MMNDMVIYDDMNDIRKEWKDDGDVVICTCNNADKKNITFDDFLDHCVCCGGNWSGMILSGIKNLWPKVYDVIPEKMGKNSFFTLCSVIRLCGVDTSV